MMPSLAPVVTIAFLGISFLLFCSLVGAAIALAFRRYLVALWLGAGWLGAALVYIAFLFGAALASREHTLTPGERKYFCEMDCHLAYAVSSHATAKVLGRPPQLVPASGTFHVVTVRTFFDPTTIAPFRGNGPLTPNPRIARLVDSAGRRFPPSAAGLAAWEEEHGPTTPLSRPLTPGESYETALVFDAPDDATGLRLFLGDPPGVENALIGHENSPGHGKIYFALAARTP